VISPAPSSVGPGERATAGVASAGVGTVAWVAWKMLWASLAARVVAQLRPPA